MREFQELLLERYMLKFLPACLLVGVLGARISAQTPAPTPAPETKDSLGRSTPQDSIFQFLEACHARDYRKATRYLDLRQMPAGQRAKDGQERATQLEDLLDDTDFDITSLSRDPEGDQTDNASPDLQHLATFRVDGQTIELQLQRIELKPGYHVWLVSASSVALIPTAHQVLAETPFEKRLPQKLVTLEVFETPVWRWIALLGMAVALWIVGGWLSRALVAGLGRLMPAPRFYGPLRLLLAVSGFRVAMETASPATLPRAVIERALGLAFSLSLAWVGAVVVDLGAERWRSHLDPRMQAVGYSVLPLGRQVLRLSFFVIAILTVLNVWGYNTTTILAGLGVGGLAVALAAQKTLENLFGGIAVIGDRPILVGDVCRFGDRVGTVTHIGLRSTRIRTPERTIISVPNAQFSSMELENISSRDKIWFHPTLNLRRDTTSGQLLEVLTKTGKILTEHPKVEAGNLPVRFVGVGAYSLDVEVAVYVTTADYEEFLKLQQDLLLKMLQAVESSGTALAVPLQESFAAPRHPAG
jgi:MscS family membrane protein